MKCIKCGSENLNNSRICLSCGNDTFSANKKLITYDYKTISANGKSILQIIDIYETLRWELTDQNETFGNGAVLNFRRDRKIRNKEQLNRIQVRLDDAINSLDVMEKEKTRLATATSITIGTVGALTFGGGMCLCLLNPVMWSYVVGGILAAVGGGIAYLAYLVYKKINKKKTIEMDAAIDKKRDEISLLCEDAERFVA